MTKQIQLTRKARTKGADHQPQAPKPRIARTGRPEAWDPSWINDACFMARHGATDVEMAAELGVALSTFYLRVNQYPEFSEAIKQGKAAFDERVENSLGHSATGYNIETEKVFANGKRFKVIEHVPANSTAQIFWLKNRRRKDWADTHELVVPMTATETNDPEPDVRHLALAALALFNEAEGATIELEANSVLQPEEMSHELNQSFEDQRPTAGQDVGLEEPFDPDFDDRLDEVFDR